MFTPRIKINRGARDEAEKPFWISYADLMTSLMVLFLVVMVAAMAVVLVLLQQEQSTADKYDALQEQILKLNREDMSLKQLIQRETRKQPRFRDVKVDIENGEIDLGAAATFKDGKSALRDPARVGEYVVWLTRLLEAHPGQAGIVDRITIAGGASPKGDYLFNLDLSMDRGLRVLCAGLRSPRAPEQAIRRRFFVGGNSFSGGGKDSRLAEGRNAGLRVELRGYTVQGDTVVREAPNDDRVGRSLPTGKACRTDY